VWKWSLFNKQRRKKKIEVERDLNGRQEEIKREIDCENKSLGMKE
jgi:hypothetical protein